MAAQKLLVSRGDFDDAQVVRELAAVIEAESVDELGIGGGAIHALWTLDGLGALDVGSADGRAVEAAQNTLLHGSHGARMVDARVRLAAFLGLADTPQSVETGETIFAALDEGEAMDDHLANAAMCADAQHAEEFISAYEETYGDGNSGGDGETCSLTATLSPAPDSPTTGIVFS